MILNILMIGILKIIPATSQIAASKTFTMIVTRGLVLTFPSHHAEL